jgi:4-amino-4-deoxy-L-arabinose transferase-like glycosyltransferase
VVCGLLFFHYGLAVRSLLLESPTVDEVCHLPAGLTYWQKRTFRLYRLNPPLVKLAAALPVLLAHPVVDPIYQTPNWRGRDPSQIDFAHQFAALNAARYFELFQLGRLLMPLFSVVGGLAVFAWSRRLYGLLGGLLSLALWTFCPNVLAHARLVTSDLGAAACGVAATYLFWRYLRQPRWEWAAASGIALGFAQLTKFSMLILYGVWPLLWAVRFVLAVPRDGRPAHLLRGLAHGVLVVVLSIATIDVGYLFEGVGTPLGDFEFGSRTFTRPVPPGDRRPASRNPLLAVTWQFRVNRFRGKLLGGIPVPLPEQFILGFDEQKIETEGIPARFWKAWSDGTVDRAREIPERSDEEREGYPVYLNGEMRRTGWGSFYLLALLYKVPEGTWLLFVLSLVALALVRRSASQWADEIILAVPPLAILFSMTFLTDINLGLRYVLPILPYIFVAMGKVAPCVLALPAAWRRAGQAAAAGSLALTVAAALWIHPHYLAYFNWASGGPDRAPARLIDSNLDWGQDLLALQKWYQETIPNERLGLAYFGQINPSIFAARGEPFSWFLPPPRPGSIRSLARQPAAGLIGPAPRLEPGYYAISATLLYGLPWRLYDPAPPDKAPEAFLGPAWNAWKFDAFGYFRDFKPIMPPIGHSIYVYHLTKQDVAGVERQLEAASP